MRHIRTAIAVLAALAAAPWVLLYLFYVALHDGSDRQPVVALGAACAIIGLVFFMIAIPRGGPGPASHYLALLAAGALFVGISVAIASA
jgi:hypothetical protein